MYIDIWNVWVGCYGLERHTGKDKTKLAFIVKVFEADKCNKQQINNNNNGNILYAVTNSVNLLKFNFFLFSLDVLHKTSLLIKMETNSKRKMCKISEYQLDA